ncbi:TetR/AcrR family transcriptional regulator [Actinomadura gamaensis]|uniref:TetR/AcrR family transcriptional regulator n=1 Tax=Actinomadura gamaensis TaxID=1763541 RepID=A0ABV9TW60_9ACTN
MAEQQTRPPRTDWQRNHQRLLQVASALVARDGTRVSLEKIAREAEVGSATLHRHFPSRRALLQEVFQDIVERLRRRAGELADGDPRTCLDTWLEELTVCAAETRGLGAWLAAEADGDPSDGECCHVVMREATAALVDRARSAGAVRPGISPQDLLTLTEAVSLVTEDDPTTARRLLRLALDGVRP